MLKFRIFYNSSQKGGAEKASPEEPLILCFDLNKTLIFTDAASGQTYSGK